MKMNVLGRTLTALKFARRFLKLIPTYLVILMTTGCISQHLSVDVVDFSLADLALYEYSMVVTYDTADPNVKIRALRLRVSMEIQREDRIPTLYGEFFLCDINKKRLGKKTWGNFLSKEKNLEGGGVYTFSIRASEGLQEAADEMAASICFHIDERPTMFSHIYSDVILLPELAGSNENSGQTDPLE